ncbi:MAG: ABC transporter permease subunit [Candidatus Bathyarchaeota archaeon]|nr:ABC transporter permease subunit [Candidatus Bathyarchaeota archaeon]
MRFWKSWIVTKKDLSVIRRNKYVFYSLIAMPLVLGVVLPTVFIFAIGAGAEQLAHEELLQTAYQIANLGTMYFVLIPAILPSIIASYSIVGEKIEKSLEPLLATPTTDGELLLGKSLASFVPCMAVTYLAAAIFVPIIDFWSYSTLGIILIPNLYWALMMFVITPLACIMSVEANIIVSSKVSDIRAAQQLGGIVVLPLIFVVLLGSIVSTSLLLAIGVTVALAVADIALFYLSKATFRREEILTKWK